MHKAQQNILIQEDKIKGKNFIIKRCEKNQYNYYVLNKISVQNLHKKR